MKLILWSTMPSHRLELSALQRSAGASDRWSENFWNKFSNKLLFFSFRFSFFFFVLLFSLSPRPFVSSSTSSSCSCARNLVGEFFVLNVKSFRRTCALTPRLHPRRSTTPPSARRRRRANRCVAPARRRDQSASRRDAVDSSVRCRRRRRRSRIRRNYLHRSRKRRRRRLVAVRSDGKSIGPLQWRRAAAWRCTGHYASGNVVVASLTSRHCRHGLCCRRRRTRLAANGLGRRAHRLGGLVPVAATVRGYIYSSNMCMMMIIIMIDDDTNVCGYGV